MAITLPATFFDSVSGNMQGHTGMHQSDITFKLASDGITDVPYTYFAEIANGNYLFGGFSTDAQVIVKKNGITQQGFGTIKIYQDNNEPYPKSIVDLISAGRVDRGGDTIIGNACISYASTGGNFNCVTMTGGNMAAAGVSAIPSVGYVNNRIASSTSTLAGYGQNIYLPLTGGLIQGNWNTTVLYLQTQSNPANGGYNIASFGGASANTFVNLYNSNIIGGQIPPSSITGISQTNPFNTKMGWSNLTITGNNFLVNDNFASLSGGIGVQLVSGSNSIFVSGSEIDLNGITKVIGNQSKLFEICGVTANGENIINIPVLTIDTSAVAGGGVGTIDLHNSILANANFGTTIPNNIGVRQRFVDYNWGPNTVQFKTYNNITRCQSDCQNPSSTSQYDVFINTSGSAQTLGAFADIDYINIIGVGFTKIQLQGNSYAGNNVFRNLKITVDATRDITFSNKVFEDCHIYLPPKGSLGSIYINNSQFLRCIIQNSGSAGVQFSGNNNMILDTKFSNFAVTGSGDIWINSLTAGSISAYKF